MTNSNISHSLHLRCMTLCILALCSSAFGQGVRVFHIGNSHTASTLQPGLEPMAHAENYPDHSWDNHNIPGAPIDWLWNHPPNGDGARGTLDVAPGFDVLTLQSYNKTDQDEIDSCINFTGLALDGNPNARVIMFTIWPGSTADWDNPEEGRSEAWPEQVKAAIEAAHPGTDVAVAPTSLVIRELGGMADAGELPGATSRFDFFSDGGHLNDLGAYAICLTFFNMIYGEDPVGVTPHDWASTPDIFDGISRETAEAIQPIIRDIVATYPPAGVDAGLISITRNLDAALENQPYSVQMEAINADGPLTWTLVGGSLPPGITLSEDGLLSGTSSAIGSYYPVIRVDDTVNTFDRTLKLIVAEDIPPTITTDVRLPDLRADEYLFMEMSRSGGVGLHTWEVVDGRMPNGMVLSEAGILLGTPGEEGIFNVTMQVSDSHPVAPQTAQKNFFWKIGEKLPGTVVVNRIEPGEFNEDGIPNESFWRWNDIENAVQGSPTAQARFALAYEQSSGRPFEDMRIAVEVTNANSMVHEEAGIDLYMDLLHNREIIFNSDDYHLFYPRDGVGWPELRQGQRSRLGYDDYVVVETANGYTLEGTLDGRKMFFGSGSLQEPAPLMVFGFDIGVRQGSNGEDRLMWRGSTLNDDDTSEFGSILISQVSPEFDDLVEETLAEWHFASGSAASDQNPDAEEYSYWLQEAPSLALGPGVTKHGNSHYADDNFALRDVTGGPFDADDYVSFTVKPKQGAQVSYSLLDFALAAWEVTDLNVELRYSTDGFATFSTIPLSKANPITLDPKRTDIPVHADLRSIPGLQDQSEPVEFRFYFWGTSTTVGIGRRDNIGDILLIGTTEETHGEASYEAENGL